MGRFIYLKIQLLIPHFVLSEILRLCAQGKKAERHTDQHLEIKRSVDTKMCHGTSAEIVFERKVRTNIGKMV